jgi:CRISPR-associated endonuclease Cas1
MTMPNASAVITVAPRHGVVTLFGYGIKVQVDRGHLVFEDGIGTARRQARFARVGHGLRRLIVVGSDGMVSLAALRWLADQDAAFVMLDRDGSVLATTGPVRPSDARLRRAQALAAQSGAALGIMRDLIGQKLVGQEQVARHKLLDSENADAISFFRAELDTAHTPETIRLLESQAGSAYWSAWRTVAINFPRNDIPRVPDHWRSFGARISPLSGSPRLAANPANAILNYLYALLESESRLAAASLGLDPGLGVLHVDKPNRDSLACDLMEPVRPQVDAFVLDWIMHEPLRREWFFEQRDGNCRLMGSFAVRLSETAPSWGRCVAPFAEWVARSLWAPALRSKTGLPTRLTQQHRREAKGQTSFQTITIPKPDRICRRCGSHIHRDRRYCSGCTQTVTRANFGVGREIAQRTESLAKRAATQRQHRLAMRNWKRADLPGWLTPDVYANRIQPALASVAKSRISATLGVSDPYSSDIRAGRRRPHPRHWETLARLVGVSSNVRSGTVR